MKTKCKDCGKIFETIYDDAKVRSCYRCSLAELTSHPEATDFNTAAVLSGEAGPHWQAWQEDLRDLRRFEDACDRYEEEQELEEELARQRRFTEEMRKLYPPKK